MLAIERKNAILSKLLMEGKVLVNDLSREYGVTEETIRRDLEKLEKEGFAKKTYGGAVKIENFNIDLPFHVRKQTNVESKQYIASVIGSMISDGDYIMLDSSTTALNIIKSIMHKKKITLITNSIEILLELSNKSGWTVISTGGMLKEGSLSLVGYQAERMVSSFHVDMAICSSKGLDSEMGVTDSNERDAEIKKAFFKSAKKRILALDSSKFDKTSFVKVCDISDINMIVTEKKPSDFWTEQLRQTGVEVVYEM
ncbi:MAG TPA: DeoR/GlpR transcriptional regulator [Ruminococcaceae bacterium]|jgi:DeoR/GlpR family transcriptional regulator of sugar metabolism|nr:DeoR/GlpR transcriptional regulator [Oscillospiraceae bacterium]